MNNDYKQEQTANEVYKMISDLPAFEEKYPLLYKYATPIKPMNRPLLGRDKELHQLRTGLMRPELCNAMLLGDAGSGKSLADDTLIPVADKRGYVAIKDLKVGDFVFDEKGKPVKVSGVYPQGLKHAYAVRFADGAEIICNDEHLWNVRGHKDPAASGGYVTKTLREMIDSYDTSDLYIPMNGATEREPVGNADFSRVGSYVFSDAPDTRIPPECMLGSVEQRFELLRKLTDSKAYTYVGEQDRRKCSFPVKSLDLAKDVLELVRSLGMRAALTESKRQGWRYKDVKYEVVIRADAAERQKLFPYFWCMEHHSDGEINNHYDDIAIWIIADLKTEMPMTCIYVDSESHLFQAGKEHIVTHNTALVQGAMKSNSERIYVEIDLSKMIADLRDANEMATRIKQLFEDSQHIYQDSGLEVVLFMDEFHLVTLLSAAAVEALKPMLADSGTRGIRVIAATTFTEFTQHIAANQPLVQRFQRISITPPTTDVVVSILSSFAQQYGVAEYIRGTHLFEQIVELSNKYIPANSQPRKSILLFDLMVGWFREAQQSQHTDIKFDIKLLHKVLSDTEGIQLNVDVDAPAIKKRLDSRVYAQYFATSAVASRLQICAADLHNKTKPMSSFLFTGSTGTGKALPDNSLIPVYDSEGKITHKRNGDLVTGDLVFNHKGKPVLVSGVYPQGSLDVYEVVFDDGRVTPCNGEHLWTCYGVDKRKTKIKTWFTDRTENIAERILRGEKLFIPQSKAVERPEREYSINPYLVGAFIGNGCMTIKTLTMSSSDMHIVSKCAKLIGAAGVSSNAQSGASVFILPDDKQTKHRRFFAAEAVFGDMPELLDKYSHEKSIPEQYKYGSVEQRFELIQGLFDTNGGITSKQYSALAYYSVSEKLIRDIREILFSLGISSRVNSYKRKNSSGHTNYSLTVKCSAEDREKFFTSPKKVAAVKASVQKCKSTSKRFDVLGIGAVRKLNKQEPMTCIMIDDPEHLYLAGQYIVTHNTELTKQLAEIMFDDPKRLIRFDMTEYALEDSLERFRSELTARVWERPYSVLLFDEIEKACGAVTRILLQVLDDGRLIDRNNREVNFLNTYIVLTTNAASEVYGVLSEYANQSGVSDEDQIKELKKYMKVIRRAITEGTGANKFPPELLGRIDAICPFMPLNDDTQRKILIRRMQSFKADVKRLHGIEVDYAQADLLKYLIYDKLDENASSGGARIVATRFEEEVVTTVAEFINRAGGQFGRLIVRVEGDMAIDNKTQLESKAYVSVYPIENQTTSVF